MSGLKDQQLGLLDLIKRRDVNPADPYLQRAAASPGLAIVRETALFWRTYQVESQCPCTSRLLKRLGSFEALVASYFDHYATSPFVEELSRDFLRTLSGHDDPLVRAVSQFEAGVLDTKSGSVEIFETIWDRDPELVMLALQSERDLPPAEESVHYRVQIGREIPGGLRVAKINSAHARERNPSWQVS